MLQIISPERIALTQYLRTTSNNLWFLTWVIPNEGHSSWYSSKEVRQLSTKGVYAEMSCLEVA